MSKESEVELMLEVPMCPEHKKSLEPRTLIIGKIKTEGISSFGLPAYYCSKCDGYFCETKIVKNPFLAAKEYCKDFPKANSLLEKTRMFEFI